MIIKNEKGEDIEVFTAEELSAKVKEAETTSAAAALEEYKKANPDKTEEVTRLQADLAKKEADLTAALAAGGNEEQITRLRKERDDAKKAEEDAKNDLGKKFEDFKQEMLGDTKKEMLDKLSGGDAELRKKIELEFDNYRTGETSRAAIAERMEKAYTLATGEKPTPGPLDNGGANGGDRGDGHQGGGEDGKLKLSENGEAIANVLGITEEDKANYEKFKKERGG